MPSGTIVQLWTFDVDAEGWSLPTLFQTVTWDGSDGSDFAGATTPGCIDYQRSGGGGGAPQLGNVSYQFSWLDIGVPADGTVVSAQIRARQRLVSSSGVTQYDRNFRLYDVLDGVPIVEKNDTGLGVADTSWNTIGMSSADPVSPTYSDPSRQVFMFINFVLGIGAGPYAVDLRTDTFELTVNYTTPAPSQEFRSIGLIGGQVAVSNAGVPIGNGSLRARSGGVIAHATLVNFSGDAALEVYFAGMEDGTNLSGVAYSLPTEFTLSNPQAGHNYILEKNATDLAQWASGRLGFVKFRRAGGAGGYSGDILFGGIEIIYTEKTV